MIDPADLQAGKEDSQAVFELWLRSAAQNFSYPPTPDIWQAVRRRGLSRPPARRVWVRLAIAGIALALIVAGLLAVPPVRAAILNWLRIGAVQIWFIQPGATPTTTPQPGPTATPPGKAGTLAPTERPGPTPLRSVLDLSGETSLADARKKVPFKVSLPAFPSDLGPPGHVFFQDLGGPVVMLVWMEKDRPQTVRMVLSETDSINVVFQKIVPASIQQTTVNGQEAMWLDGPYMLISGSGEADIRRLIQQGHTLVWTAGKMTYRLETSADLATALRMAESLVVEP